VIPAKGRLLVGLHWKTVTIMNTLAYYTNVFITEVKSFLIKNLNNIHLALFNSKARILIRLQKKRITIINTLAYYTKVLITKEKVL
jgi:hypothetical protein